MSLRITTNDALRIGILSLSILCLHRCPHLDAQGIDPAIFVDSVSIYNTERRFADKHRCESLLADIAYERRDIAQYLHWQNEAATTLGRNMRALERAAAFLDSAAKRVWCTPDDSLSIEAAGWVQVTRANITRQLGNADAALIRYEEVFRLFRGIGLRTPKAAKDLYKRMANLYTQRGDFERSEALLHHALAIFQVHELPDEIALVRSDLGVLYQSMGDPDGARKQYLLAIAAPSIRSFTKATVKVNYGILLMEFHPEIDSLAKSEQCLLDAIKWYGKSSQEVSESVIDGKIGQVHQKLGDLYSVLQKPIKAETHFLLSIDHLRKAYPKGQARELAKTYIAFGDFATALRLPDSAIHHFQLALQSVLPEFLPKSPGENPNPSQLYPENSIMEALIGKANALTLRYEISKHLLDLRHALDCHILAGMVEDTLQAGYLTDPSKLIVAKDRHQRTERVLGICLQLWLETDSIHYLETAFHLAERTKAALLRERILRRRLAPPAGPLAVAAVSDRRIRADMESLSDLDDPSPQHQARLLRLQDSCSRLQAEIQRRFPEYHAIYSNRHTIRLQALQSSLAKQGQTMLHYFVGDSAAYVFVIDSGCIQLLPLTGADSITQWARDFDGGLEAMLANDSATITAGAQRYAWAAARLQASVLKPLRSCGRYLGRRLVVVPDGALLSVNFAALLRRYPPDIQRFGDYSYVCEDFLFTHAYSGSLYHDQVSSQQATPRRLEAVAFAPTTVQGMEIPEYQMQVMQTFKDELGYQTIQGEAAKKSEFLSAAKSTAVIYLMAHNQPGPQSSGIQFPDGQFLSREELYHRFVHVNARLMVMIDCDLGQGELLPGEGIQSQSMALFAAGCPSLIAPSWQVRESKIALQTVEIARALAAGKSKDAALNAGYEAILHSEDLPDIAKRPSNWAGLVLWGDPRPVAIANESRKLPWLLILGIAALLLGIPLAHRVYRRRVRVFAQQPRVA